MSTPQQSPGIREINADLLDALVTAERLLTVAMREDLGFGPVVTERIIGAHDGMRQVRAAIAKATTPAPEAR